ncbi:M55 family metallopeptidase [Glycomyces paridis]|uniref:Peptide ABC transporter substrate-binding protein n=1 Tax=Glycomyces paridis TaxID=2126555 RepID=A0A4V4HPQ6_9ACTN|nr:M55 family metallopeptidase [Glycomyces paridis]THV30866.1 peptide ABC transporter substrate-binding protein [Glycomyces paridis]
MRILISADMEGVTGVTSPSDVIPGTPGWERMRRLFTGDVNAAMRGLGKGLPTGSWSIDVNDAHSTMRNLLLDELNPGAHLISGRHKPLGMMQGLDKRTCEGVVFLGYHAGAGMEGVLAHTYLENTITGVWLDGALASEGRLNAALAAEYGVPVIMVTGDSATIRDAEDYAPKAFGAVVKHHVSRYAAICDSPDLAWREIATVAEAAGRRLVGRHEPVVSSHVIEVEFDASHLADAVTVIPGVEKSAVRQVAFELPTMYEAIRCFKAVTTIASAAMEEKYG